MKKDKFCDTCIFTLLGVAAKISTKKAMELDDFMTELSINSFLFGYLLGTGKIKTKSDGKVLHLLNDKGLEFCKSEFAKMMIDVSKTFLGENLDWYS